MSNIYVFDIEVYKNLFSVIFMNVETGKIHTFLFYQNKGKGLFNLFKFLKSIDNLILVGHNSVGYDSIILSAICKYGSKLTNERIKRLSDKIIRDEEFKQSNTYKELRKGVFWKQIDTLLITRLNRLLVSLKQCGVMLKFDKVQDLPFHFDNSISEDQVDILLKYNLNDVQTQLKLYHHLLGDILLRNDIGEKYGVDLSSANQTEIAKFILSYMYSQETGIPERALYKLKADVNPESIIIGDCIGKNLVINHPYLQEVLDEIRQIEVYEYEEYKYSRTIEFDNVTYDLGIGGLHSKDKPMHLVSNDEYYYDLYDFTSYYPNIEIVNEFYPLHLDKKAFLTVLIKLTTERTDAKKLRDVSEEMALKERRLKIAINSLFGLSGYAGGWLYDPKFLISTTVTGQWYLFDLIDKLHGYDIHVMSANTDGVLCKVPVEKREIYNKVCKEVSDRIGIGGGHDEMTMYICRDVNNYICEMTNGKVKYKGVFEVKVKGFNRKGVKSKTMLHKSFNMPIVSMAMYDYYIHNVPVEDTIRNHSDIYDFMKCQRVDTNTFIPTLVSVNKDYTLFGEEELTKKEGLQKTNRYIITNYGDVLLKKRKVALEKDELDIDQAVFFDMPVNAGEYNLARGECVQVLNDVSDSNAHNYDLNYDYYINETNKIIHKIKPVTTQLTFF